MSHIDWLTLKPKLILSTGLSFAIATVIGTTTDFGFSTPFAILMVTQPVRMLLEEKIASRNPHYAKSTSPAIHWTDPLYYFIPVLVLSGTISYLSGFRFFESFAYVALGASCLGAINGIFITTEDNEPSGWLHPEDKG